MDRITRSSEEDFVWRSVLDTMLERRATQAEAVEACGPRHRIIPTKAGGQAADRDDAER
jgi:hypothetical protein